MKGFLFSLIRTDEWTIIGVENLWIFSIHYAYPSGGLSKYCEHQDFVKLK